MTPDWTNPVKTWGTPGTPDDYANQLAPLFEAVLNTVAPMIAADPLTAKFWVGCENILDARPEPHDVDSANQRWGEFLSAVKKLRQGHERRARIAEAARR